MPAVRPAVPASDESLQLVQSLVWGVVFMCTWVAVAVLLPGRGTSWRASCASTDRAS